MYSIFSYDKVIWSVKYRLECEMKQWGNCITTSNDPMIFHHYSNEKFVDFDIWFRLDLDSIITKLFDFTFVNCFIIQWEFLNSKVGFEYFATAVINNAVLIFKENPIIDSSANWRVFGFEFLSENINYFALPTKKKEQNGCL